MEPGVLRSAWTTFPAVAMFGQAYTRAVASTPMRLSPDGREVISQPSWRLGPIGGDREALIAGRHQFHRTTEPLCGDGDPRCGREPSLGAERTADISRDDADIRRIEAELASDRRLRPPHHLAGLIDRQLRPFPHASGGEQLDRIVVLCRGLIAGLNLDRSGGEGRLGVAFLRVRTE
jgi:hypothetical protein